MQTFVTVMCILSQTLVAFISQPTTTQPGRGGRGQPGAIRANYEPIVLRLTNANCFEISNMLSATFSGCTSYPVEQSNSIIFSGPPDSLAMVRKLVAEMDVMADQSDEPRVVIADVKHRRVDELVERLLQITDGRRLRVSGDRGRSKVLLRGDPKDIAQVEALVEKLDTPSVPVAVEFAFIQASEDPDGPPVPADLAEVAKELERYGKLTLWGRLSTIAVEGEKFGIEGQIVPGVKAEVRGMISSGSPAETVKIELKASLFLNTRPSAEKASVGPYPYFELETVVAPRRGEYLVLGSAPTGTAAGESAILVMHVKP